MEKSAIKFLQDGDASLLVWSCPAELRRAGGLPACMAIPLQARSGGLLLAVPEPFLDNDMLLDAAMESHDGVLGPSQEFTSDLCEEDDENVHSEF